MPILKYWKLLSKLPFGKAIFNWALGQKVPYTGSIRPQVLKLDPGRAQILMKDRRSVRNHLNSIHAVALMNLGEVASGLAVLTKIPEQARAIALHLEIDFLKKARGTLIAECEFLQNPGLEEKEFEAEAHIYNGQKEEVARVKARWLVGPKKEVK